MAPYLYFTAFLMLLWAGVGVLRLFRPRNGLRFAHCLVPAIPVLLLLLPHSPLSASDLTYNYAGGGAFAGSAVQSVDPGGGAKQAADTPAAALGADPSDAELSGADAAQKRIEVGDDEFYSWLNELYVNLELYEGYQISVTGFVFRDPEVFAADEFMPARLGMTCCVADLVPYGLICKYAGADELEVDSWVRVEGVVQKGEYEGFEEPQIAVTSITPADPVEGYLYPFF
jgi:putative membrane protein